MNKSDLSPVRSSERYVILDALRGFALLGIAMANFPEFSLYTFMSSEDTATLPLSGVDQWVRYLLYFFVDGKFYTIFSLLFGIGFSIILKCRTKRRECPFCILQENDCAGTYWICASDVYLER